jgi:1-acyl-sn-glycerol-3-phosphate acyltransferase
VRDMNWIWTIGAPLVRAVMGLLFRVRIEGMEHVPRSGAVIVAPNHVSVLDGPAVSAAIGTHRWRATHNLIAGEVFSGLIGWILRQAQQIPIKRGTGDTGALDAAIRAIEDGWVVGIFPEGRVTDDPRGPLQRIRSGITRVALPEAAPVVPVGIWGTQSIWSRTGLDRGGLLRRPLLVMVFGTPVSPTPGEPPTEFRERYRLALEQQVARARELAGDLGP